MARIKMVDLPKDMEISKEEMGDVSGGIGTWPTPEMPMLDYYRATQAKVFTRSRPGYLFIDTVPLPE